jgi:phosphoenolpyruvate synthase/pyruvate phosphate dikinase
MKSYTLLLDSPLATLGVAGGKGGSPSELARAGFPVPPGFVVATESERRAPVAM